MRTLSPGRLHRNAFRYGLVSVAAIILAGCSSDSDRLSFFGVDQAQLQTVAVVQPGLQPAYGQTQQVQYQPAPYTAPVTQTAPSYTAPGYPQTTASISQPAPVVQQTYQSLPAPVVQQPTYATVQRAPVIAPNAHLAQTPGGLVGAQVPQTIQVPSITTPTVQVQQPQVAYQVPQVTYQAPQVTYQQPTVQVAAPQIQPAPITTPALTTASIGAPQVITPQPLAFPATTGSVTPVTSAPISLPAPSIAPVQTASVPTASPGWSAVGGTRVTVGQGETLFSMSRRYGVPVDAIQRANGISDPSSIRMGQQILIPVYSTSGAPITTASTGAAPLITGSTPNARWSVPAPTPRPSNLRSFTVAAATTPVVTTAPTMPTAGTHVVASGETLYSIARRYNMSAQQLIAANQINNPNSIRIGQRLVVSSTAQALPPVAQLPQATQTPAQVVAARSYTPPRPEQQHAIVEQTAAIQQVAARADDIAEQTPLQFRWPIRGRVISGFGADLSPGNRNDGVNIAVPEGASIRAAEEGEVVYAGNQLRGFGNLVLVQHRGGYVTAYAHNSRLDVQRGDRVQRGDVIARAGSTGDVDTPQLHFEIRRGTTPVDPSPYLPAS